MSALKSKKIDGVRVVRFADGELLDEAIIEQLGDDLQTVASGTKEKQKLLLSFHGVRFMSSAVLGKLVRFSNQCRENGAALKVSSISPDILEVFKITKLHKMFDIENDEKSAMEAFSRND